MRIKICGITNLEDALLCYQSGAHALGFIFAEVSPRKISLEQCKQITLSLPPFCERVGVFVDESFENILNTVQQCKLSVVQLHGTSEDADYIDELSAKVSVPIIRALRVDENTDLKKLIQEIPAKKVQAILLDGPGKKKVPLEMFLEAKELSKLPLILAGAINADNVQELTQKLNPIAIDLSSSLEAAPGKKDFAKVKEFFEKVKLLDSGAGQKV